MPVAVVAPKVKLKLLRGHGHSRAGPLAAHWHERGDRAHIIMITAGMIRHRRRGPVLFKLCCILRWWSCVRIVRARCTITRASVLLGLTFDDGPVKLAHHDVVAVAV
jgi:hypothetical protein